MEVYMEGFYEQDREENGLAINRNGDHTFVPHYHANLEILLVKKGRYRVNVNENTYEVKDGCLLVVDSYDIHAYKKNLDGETFDTCVLVIPYEYLRKFNIWKRGKRIENPFLSNSELCGKLLQLIDGYLIGERNEKILEAGIDLFLSILCNQLHFVEEKSKILLKCKIYFPYKSICELLLSLLKKMLDFICSRLRLNSSSLIPCVLIFFTTSVIASYACVACLGFTPA